MFNGTTYACSKLIFKGISHLLQLTAAVQQHQSGWMISDCVIIMNKQLMKIFKVLSI